MKRQRKKNDRERKWKPKWEGCRCRMGIEPGRGKGNKPTNKQVTHRIERRHARLSSALEPAKGEA